MSPIFFNRYGVHIHRYYIYNMMNTTSVNTKTDHPYFCMDDMLRVKYNVIFNMNTTSVTTWKHWKHSIQAINKFCKEDNFYKIYAEPEYYSSLMYDVVIDCIVVIAWIC